MSCATVVDDRTVLQSDWRCSAGGQDALRTRPCTALGQIQIVDHQWSSVVQRQGAGDGQHRRASTHPEQSSSTQVGRTGNVQRPSVDSWSAPVLVKFEPLILPSPAATFNAPEFVSVVEEHVSQLPPKVRLPRC